MSETDVVIIGAGSAGLLLAQGLKSAGISFRIFEQRISNDAAREWSMSLHWGGEFLEKILPPEIYSRQKQINADPHYDDTNEKGFVQCNGETAETILLMAGFMPRRVSRRKLRKLLSEGINVEFGKKLEKIEKNAADHKVTAHFHDGSSATARLVVGCDGSRSRVREILVGNPDLSRNTELPYALFNFTAKFDEQTSRSIRDIHPTFKVGYHPTQHTMGLIAMADAESLDAAQWKHQLLLSWSGSPRASELSTREAKVERLKNLASQWAHPWSTAYGNVSDDTDIYVDDTAQWDPRQVFRSEGGKSSWNGHDWDGLVTLAGDSMHTMLPHRGQGLNNALEDASRLLTLVTTTLKDQSRSLQSAIAEYEAEAVARGGAEVELTSRQARAAHDWELLMSSPMFKHGANKVK